MNVSTENLKLIMNHIVQANNKTLKQQAKASQMFRIKSSLSLNKYRIFLFLIIKGN